MEIKAVKKEDLADLANLYQQLIPNKFSIKKMEEVLNNNDKNHNHLVLGAKIDDKLVGTLLSIRCEMLFGECKSFMVIEDVVVDEKHRGLGVGKKLMNYIEEHARKNDCSYIMLITDSNRVDSQNFYKSLGYNADEYCAFKKSIN